MKATNLFFGIVWILGIFLYEFSLPFITLENELFNPLVAVVGWTLIIIFFRGTIYVFTKK